MDEQDKDVSVNGKKLPSFVRLDWALKDPEARESAYAQMVTGSWDTLSDFEKEIAGRKPAKGVSRGWLAFHAITDGFRGNLTSEDVPDWLRDAIPGSPTEDGTVSKEHKIQIAKWVNKHHAPGFYKDFLFSLEPKYRRLRVLPVVTKSKASKTWREIFQAAESQFRLIERSRANNYNVPYTITGVQDSWDDYAKNTLYPYLRKNASETFKKELELLGGVDLLRTMITDG